MTAGSDKILATKADRVGWLALNNPARRNAISLEMWHALSAALDDFASDPSVRVIVIRGAGGKAFASGADISQFEDQRKNAEQSKIFGRASAETFRRLEEFSKPVIAMIEGYCIGGGVRLAAAADIRVASEQSVFAIPAAKLGLGYSFDSVRKLVELIGSAMAKDILFTGRRLDAKEALRIGLVTHVVPADNLDMMVRQTAADIAINAPLTIRAAKIAIDQAVRDPAARDMALVESSIRACFDSRDYAIGRAAFMEKRKPEFTGS